MSLLSRLSVVVMVASLSPLGFASAPTSKLIKEYHPMERSRTILVQADQLILGRTGTASEGSNFVEVFDTTSHTLIHSLRVPHALRGLQAIDGDCQILAFGVRGYSVIDFCSGKDPQVDTYSFGMNFVPHQGTHLGTRDSFLFSEPNSGIIHYRGSSRQGRLQDHVSMTVSMNYWFDQVWIANYSNIAIFDPSSRTLTKVFEDNEVYGWKYTAAAKGIDGGDYILATARDDSTIGVIDPSGSVVQLVEAKGDPEGVVAFGHCVAIADSSLKQIVFFKVDGDQSKIISAWDATGAGDRLKYPSEIAVHPESRQVFLRSSYPCPTCSVTQSSLFAFAVADTTVWEDCQP